MFLKAEVSNPQTLPRSTRGAAKQLGQMPNTVLIEGHTDASPFGESAEYTNWELSADRANAARKLMQENGLKLNQVAEIRGYADQQLRLPDKPQDPSNRRISIIIRYTDAPDASAGKEKPGTTAKEVSSDGKAGEKSKEPPTAPTKSPAIAEKGAASEAQPKSGGH